MTVESNEVTTLKLSHLWRIENEKLVTQELGRRGTPVSVTSQGLGDRPLRPRFELTFSGLAPSRPETGRREGREDGWLERW